MSPSNLVCWEIGDYQSPPAEKKKVCPSLPPMTTWKGGTSQWNLPCPSQNHHLKRLKIERQWLLLLWSACWWYLMRSVGSVLPQILCTEGCWLRQSDVPQLEKFTLGPLSEGISHVCELGYLFPQRRWSITVTYVCTWFSRHRYKLK